MKRNSFTVVELLLVIAIIGLIAAVIIVATIGARAKARDTKREAELDQIRKSLESYFIDKDKYPTTTDWISLEDESNPETQTFIQKMKPNYLSIIPRDPLYQPGGEYSYQYIATTTGSYILCVKEERGGFFCFSSATYTGAHSAEKPGGAGGGNQTPDMISCIDDAERISAGGTVTFTAQWTDPDAGETVRLLISEDSNFTNCNYNTQTGCLSYSAPTTVSPAAATYVTQTGDGKVVWYAQICDDGGLCDQEGQSSITAEESQVSDDFSDNGTTYDDDLLYAGREGGTDWTSGFRVIDVLVYQNAQIVSSSLRVRVLGKVSTPGSGSLIIKGIDEGNTVTWSSSSLPSQRPKTTASTTIPLLNTGTQNLTVTSMVQEIVNRADWFFGNAMAMTIGNYGFTTDNYNQFERYPYTYAAKILIDFIAAKTLGSFVVE